MWENRLIDFAVDIVVYQSATHGEHAGKLSVLLTTRQCDVYGLGMNTLLTNSTFNRDYPMLEGSGVSFSSWVKVDKLCEQSVKKIAIGFGWGAAVTRHCELLIWGTGATTYLHEPGIDIVELYDPDVMCRFCNYPCADYPRRVGNTFFSYCTEQQKLVMHPSPPLDVPTKRLGNRRYGALICSGCLKECDIEVMENHSFNFCNTCNHLWDVDENARPMNFASSSMGPFLRRLDYPGRIRDIAPHGWGFWALTDSNRLVFSGFFIPPDEYSIVDDIPIWWKQPLGLPHLKPPQKLISTHSSKSDVFVVAENGVLYKRIPAEDIRSNKESHTLSQVPLAAGVKKMCCGRLASLCLLDDGTVWIIYSSQNEDQQPDAEEVHGGKGANGCLDVSGISYVDLFYVHTCKYQGHTRKRHPLMGNLVEIIFGELDCKTFLWYFSDQCKVWSDGHITYDVLAVSQLINNQLSLWRSRDHSPHREVPPESKAEPATVTSAGVGIPVGVTLWSSWGPRLVRTAAVGWQYVVDIYKRAGEAILDRLRPPQLAAANSSTDIMPPVNLPPFQSGLYGKTQLSDLTLHLYDGTFPAHRIVLCSTSKYFRHKLAGNSNSDIKYLDVKLYNPRAYRCLLKHFYQIEPNALIMKDMLDLLLLAASYDERRIAEEVEEKIKLMVGVDNVTRVMEVATQYSFRSLQQECELFMKTNAAFQEKYETTSDPKSPLTSPLQTNPRQ